MIESNTLQQAGKNKGEGVEKCVADSTNRSILLPLHNLAKILKHDDQVRLLKDIGLKVQEVPLVRDCVSHQRHSSGLPLKKVHEIDHWLLQRSHQHFSDKHVDLKLKLVGKEGTQKRKAAKLVSLRRL